MNYTDIPESIRTQMQIDNLIFGSSFCLKTNGTYERIDPMRVELSSDGSYKIREDK
jgi:hypothetical protein